MRFLSGIQEYKTFSRSTLLASSWIVVARYNCFFRCLPVPKTKRYYGRASVGVSTPRSPLLTYKTGQSLVHLWTSRNHWAKFHQTRFLKSFSALTNFSTSSHCLHCCHFVLAFRIQEKKREVRYPSARIISSESDHCIAPQKCLILFKDFRCKANKHWGAIRFKHQLVYPTWSLANSVPYDHGHWESLVS